MTAIELQEAIKKAIRDLGYNMNRRWSIQVGNHILDNAKVGGWAGPQVWLNNKLLQKTEDEELLTQVLTGLQERLGTV